jgi:hypothetical protein
MTGNAFSLFLALAGLAVLAGVIGALAIGPRRPWAVIVPVIAAFAALYLVGHELGFGVGPTVALFGFDVSLASDVVVALIAAFTAAWGQRAIVRRRVHEAI